MKKTKSILLLTPITLLLCSATAEASKSSSISTGGTVAIFVGVAVFTLLIKYFME
ncbi:MAG: hypothetical protein GXZ13_05955 [Synergistaceae bacterium]|nr:hypothetical protein [Synergistaceae bacterium]